MTPDLEQRLRERLATRAERLVKLAVMPHCPTVVLALVSEHVTTTAMLLLGQAFSLKVFEKLLICLREQNGVCFCGTGMKQPGQPLCERCLEDMDQVDREIDQMVAMDAPAKGRVS